MGVFVLRKGGNAAHFSAEIFEGILSCTVLVLRNGGNFRHKKLRLLDQHLRGLCSEKGRRWCPFSATKKIEVIRSLGVLVLKKGGHAVHLAAKILEAV